MAEKEIRKIRKTVVPDEDGDAVDRKYMREAVRQAKKQPPWGMCPSAAS
ncbi:hypothetical protein [Clostridium sp. AN503]